MTDLTGLFWGELRKDFGTLKAKRYQCSKLGEMGAGKKTVEKDVDGGGLACEGPALHQEYWGHCMLLL